MKLLKYASSRTLVASGLLAFCFIFALYYYNIPIGGPLAVTSDGANQVCRIPVLNPYDKSIHQFISQSVSSLRCDEKVEILKFENGSMCLDVKLAQKASEIIQSCSYKCVHMDYGQNRPIFGQTLKFQLDPNFCSKIPCEVMNIFCNSSNTQLNNFNTLRLNIVPTPKNPTQPTKNRHNIVVILLDSVSRSNSIRQLTLTREYLLKNLSAIELTKFLRVGENTYPNLIPLLTGHPVGYRRFPNYKGPFDDWPLIWKDAEKQGFVTMFSQDWQESSVFVMSGLKGFRRKPTNHQPRAYWTSVFKSRKYIRGDYYCYGHRPLHKILLDYLADFTKAYPNEPQFSVVMITKVSHTFLPATAGRADKDLQDFFKSFHEQLKDSFVFFLSDHGLRYAEMRQTYVGRYEVNMPFAFFLAPESFAKTHKDKLVSLQKNAMAEITTVFDLHKTMADLIYDFEPPQTRQWQEKLGQSLFNKLPRDRNCLQAGIPNEFCVCQTDFQVSTKYNWVTSAAKQLIKHVNGFIRNHSQCAELHVKSVQMVLARSHHEAVHKNILLRFFQNFNPGNHFNLITMSVLTNPSDAVFEGDLLYNPTIKQFVPTGVISRTNQYGNDSSCVNDDLLKPFCFCL